MNHEEKVTRLRQKSGLSASPLLLPSPCTFSGQPGGSLNLAFPATAERTQGDFRALSM